MGWLWSDDAACVGYPTELFFPDTWYSVDEALAVCAACPVTQQCLAFIMSQSLHERRHGIWGGTTPAQRTQLAKTAGLPCHECGTLHTRTYHHYCCDNCRDIARRRQQHNYERRKRNNARNTG